jgi:hypothetical protein
MNAVALKFEDYIFPDEAKSKWENSEIIKAIHRSQHTQRNYDLTKTIPIEDIKTIITSATQCPSKQNISFYDLHVITDQSVIFDIFETTTNIHADDDEDYKRLSNPQVLANMLLVFTEKKLTEKTRHRELNQALDNKQVAENSRIVNNDRHVAVGIAAGYVNLTASLLGYETGCCSCVMNYDKLKNILGTTSSPILLMGVGFKKEGVNRKVHALAGTQQAVENNWVDMFKATQKEAIKINYIR